MMNTEIDMTTLHKKKNLTTAHENNKSKIIIDTHRLEYLGFVSIDESEQRNNINAEFRAIKHELISNAFSIDEDKFQIKNLVMLTSSLPNTGKTFCAINLALMLSLEKNKSVLLVDADVLKPSLYKVMNFKNRLGLTDYLNDNVTNAEDVIYETSIPNLKILPAGKIHSLTYELLASDKMQALKDFFVKNYKDSIIIFDGPPVFGVIETVSLSKLVGQVAIVVEHNKTKLSDLKDVMTKLHRNSLTSVIINKSVSKKIGKYGYGYYQY